MADIQPPDSPQSSGGLKNILNDTADDIHIFDADDDDNTKEENIVRRHAQHVVPAVSPPRPTITSASNKNAPLSPTGKSLLPILPLIWSNFWLKNNLFLSNFVLTSLS